MFIGSRATNTILDVFRIGLSELIRKVGLPREVVYKTPGCQIRARANDLGRRVDNMRIIFDVRDGVKQDEVIAAMEETRIGARVKFENGSCTLQVPPFEWRQLPMLAPLDKIVQNYAKHTMRSQTWVLEPLEYVGHNLNINILIEEMEKRKASDLHLRAGAKPYIRVDNDLMPLENMPVLSAGDVREFLLQLGGEEEHEALMAEKEISFQYHAAGIGYLRCSGYVKTGAIAIAIRLIPEEPPSFESLNLPLVVRDVCNRQRGLFLVCGITGSGKSTTLAAMVDFINQTRFAHIITVEDPIEYVYQDKKSVISQRQVGRDTYSFANALRGALREDPDVILVGEMRDMETIRAGLSAAETGHLVFSTLHTTTAVDTINRIISYFPQNERDLIRQELAYTLQGVVCQRLVKRAGGGRVPIVEILLGGRPIVRDAILDGDIDKLHGIIEVDGDMTSFDEYAVKLYQNGTVSREEAISACSNEQGFERVISGIKSSEGRKILK
ncbi:MAG: PilT/PilU family type 4a pilus ATPase [Candidatus Hydrogenedentes bacterium]|nr:PilT/PilU family type 4a pilus ATPase [Candidatus Hydrogenedentota bacterium]